MATIQKRGKKFRVMIRRKGANISETFGTKAQAEMFARRMETEQDQGKALDNKLLELHKTFEDALEEYGRRVSHFKPSVVQEMRRIKRMKETFLAPLLLTQITKADMARYRDERMLVVSGSTVNRDFNFISHVFTVCVNEWLWMEENPCSRLRRPKENQPRSRRVYDHEIKTLRFVMGYENDVVPETVEQLACCEWLIAIETGMRQGEVHSIDKDNFFNTKTGAYVHLDKTKNQTERDAACTKRAVQLIKLKLKSKIKGRSDVVGIAFGKAVKRALIDDMHYHDSRHEAITRLAPKLDILALARTVGIKDLKVLQVYYEDDALEASKRLD